MKGRVFRFFRWFLLLCVVLNLGDAPYVDEVLTDAGRTPAFAPGTSADHGQASSPHDSAGRGQLSPYENLFANVPMPAEDIAPPEFNKPSDAVPHFAGFSVPAPPISRLERPPRSATLCTA